MRYIEMLELAKTDDRSNWPGTYASVHLTRTSKAKLTSHFKNYIPRLKEQDSFHITTTYTKRILDIKSKIVAVNLYSKHFKYEKFGDTVLVMRVYHPVLEKLFLESRKAGATWDFPSYRPHITLSTEFPSDIANLPPLPDFNLYTSRHIVEPLDD